MTNVIAWGWGRLGWFTVKILIGAFKDSKIEQHAWQSGMISFNFISKGVSHAAHSKRLVFKTGMITGFCVWLDRELGLGGTMGVDVCEGCEGKLEGFWGKEGFWGMEGAFEGFGRLEEGWGVANGCFLIVEGEFVDLLLFVLLSWLGEGPHSLINLLEKKWKKLGKKKRKRKVSLWSIKNNTSFFRILHIFYFKNILDQYWYILK